MVIFSEVFIVSFHLNDEYYLFLLNRGNSLYVEW